jgi:hypothetical protein
MNDENFTDMIIGWQFLLGIMLILFVTAIIHTIAQHI